MIRFLLASAGVLLVGSIGAFLLYVSVLSIAAVVWIQVGLMLMFGLGVQVGTQASQAGSRGHHPAFLTIRSHLTAYGYVPGGAFLHLAAEMTDKEHIQQLAESVRDVPLGTVS